MRLFAIMLMSFCVSAVADPAMFGDAMPEGEPIALSKAIPNSSDSEIKVSGRITEVCQKKGCFMVLTDGDSYARVRFKDYGFFVPKDSSNSNAIVYGTLTQKTLSPRQANHYERDAGRKGDIASEVTEYTIMASSVAIL